MAPFSTKLRSINLFLWGKSYFINDVYANQFLKLLQNAISGVRKFCNPGKTPLKFAHIGQVNLSRVIEIFLVMMSTQVYRFGRLVT